MEVEVKSYWSLFISEVFNPFYLFQAFSIMLWSADEYYYYAACVLFLTTVSVTASLVQTKRVGVLNFYYVTTCFLHSAKIIGINFHLFCSKVWH